jgi:hypothetical protein
VTEIESGSSGGDVLCLGSTEDETGQLAPSASVITTLLLNIETGMELPCLVSLRRTHLRLRVILARECTEGHCNCTPMTSYWRASENNTSPADKRDPYGPPSASKLLF